MLTIDKALHILQTADLVYSAKTIEQSIQRMASEITERLSDRNPLVLCVMKGSVVFAGCLLTKLAFPLSFDYLQISRYHNETSGGRIDWMAYPQEDLQGRTVLVVDDILDEGVTMAEIRNKVLDCGAQSFYSAVLIDKNTGVDKPHRADFVGLVSPNQYIFGFGMDVYGAWRNLPAIYALNTELDD